MNRARLTLLSAVLLAAAEAASADLLVTRDGATIETAGAWRVDGRRVVFTLPNGSLSSIRTDEVDLDRSALATARAAEAASGEAPAVVAATPGAPILRLSEDDLPTVTEEGEEVAAEKKEAAAEPETPLKVQSWEQMPMPNDDGIQLFGVVKNTGTTHMTAVSVTAVLYGEEGGMLANGDAQLNQTTIGPGATANFRVEFPGLPDFASVKFTTSARGFETVAPEGEGEGEGERPLEEEPPAAEEPPPGDDEGGAPEDEEVVEPPAAA